MAVTVEDLKGHYLVNPDLVHTDFEAKGCVCRQNHAVFVTPGGRVFDPIQDTPKPNSAVGADGGICFKCGGMTVRTGTCTTCTSCGESGGCG